MSKSNNHKVHVIYLNSLQCQNTTIHKFCWYYNRITKKKTKSSKDLRMWDDKLGSGGRCLLSYLHIPTFKSDSAFGWLNFLGLWTLGQNLFIYLFIFIISLENILLWIMIFLIVLTRPNRIQFLWHERPQLLYKLFYNIFCNMITHVLLP